MFTIKLSRIALAAAFAAASAAASAGAIHDANLFNGNTLTNVTLASPGTNVAANIGAYTITATNAVGTGIANYQVTYVTNTFTVTPAPLTVTKRAPPPHGFCARTPLSVEVAGPVYFSLPLPKSPAASHRAEE